MDKQVKIVLKSGKDQSLRRRHPWVFSGAIKKIYGQPAEGDLVEVYDNKEEQLGTGHYQDGSIAIRMLTFGDIGVGEGLFARRVTDAWNHRREEGLYNAQVTNAFRNLKCGRRRSAGSDH